MHKVSYYIVWIVFIVVIFVSVLSTFRSKLLDIPLPSAFKDKLLLPEFITKVPLKLLNTVPVSLIIISFVLKLSLRFLSVYTNDNFFLKSSRPIFFIRKLLPIERFGQY